MVLLISYDLNGHERPAAYEAVKAYIEQHSTSSIRPLYSQWFVETMHSAQAWVDGLRKAKLIDANDRLFVNEVLKPYQGSLDSADWAWLNARARQLT
jgi:hypothetical protein